MNIANIIILTYLLGINSFVVFSNRICKNYNQHYLKDKFTPVTEEVNIKINHENKLFKQLKNSFFAQIGSNPKHVEGEDYHWFDGDGMIHGIFFNNSFMTYNNKWIQTKRLEVEDKWNKKMYLYFGELKGFNGIYQIFKYAFMEILGFLPPAKGTANTALLDWENEIYALHEGDMPYNLNVNYSACTISTKGRLNYKNIYSTTAHPIIDKKRKLLYLYGYNNYDFVNGKFIFNVFNRKMELLNQKNITLLNNGMTHDVGFTGNDIIIPDMPLKYDFARMFKQELPLYFDNKDGITRFGIFNVKTQQDPDWYYFNNNFFIFHFAKTYKKNNKYNIFACVMNELHMEDFVEVDHVKNPEHIIRGDLRLKKIIIDIKKNTTKIIENENLNNLPLNFNYNLDFPIESQINKNHIYCTIFNAGVGYIHGYVKINTKNFEKSEPQIFLFENNMYGNSEPQVVVINNKEYLLTFTNDDIKSYISLIDIDNNTIDSIEINARIPPGFHSLYLKHKN